MSAKKIIIISISVLGFIALAVGIYFAWQNSQKILTPPPAASSGASSQGITINQPNNSGPGAVTASKLQVVSKQEILGYWIYNPAVSATSTKTSASTTVSASTSTVVSSITAPTIKSGIYYLSSDGNIFKVSVDGNDTAITQDGISDIQQIKSSLDGKRVLVKYGTFISPSFKIFNTESGMFESAPTGITAADFSPDGKKLAYFQTSGDKSNLIVKDLVNFKAKLVTVVSIYQKDMDLNWISANKIILTEKPTALYAGKAWSVDINKKTFTKLPIAINGADGQGLMLNWSSNGRLGVEFLTSADGRGRYLSIVNATGTILANLNFSTLPNKCFVSDPQIYCAVPDNIPERTTLPDDYLKNAAYFTDSLYLIDATPGSQNPMTMILDGSGAAIDAMSLKFADGKLFFINKYDNKLYALDLR